MSPGVGIPLAALVLGLALPQTVGPQTSCNVSLDESIVVEPGELRPCGIVVVGHDVTVARAGSVDGGVIVAFGRAAIDGEIKGSVNVLGGDAAVSGRVRGDVYASGVVRLSAGARVQGNVTGGDIRSAAGAQVDGAATELGRGWAGLPRGRRPWLSDASLLLFKVVVTLLLAGIFGALATLAAPAFVGRLRWAASRGPGAVVVAVGIGLAVLAGTAAIVFALRQHVSVGAVIALPAMLVLVGALGVGGRLGARLLPQRRSVLQTALGFSLVAAMATAVLQLGHWAIFCTGGLVFVLVGAWSIGVVALALIGRRADRRSADAPVPLPAAPPGGAETPEEPAAPGGPAAPGEPAALGRPAAPGEPAALEVPAAPIVSRTPRGAQSPDPASEPEAAHVSEAPTAPASDRTAPPEGTTEARAPAGGSADAAPLPMDAGPAPALDLRRIPGISPIYAHVLRAAGVTSLVELAERDPDDIVASLAVPGVLGIDRATAELWVAMARRRLGR
ncbi:MAG: DUF4332 domain-containing protein [Ardenticatenales bacterium]|nr:DUF4332 domain-containing protein [Ardenticatenales bacterium]